MKRIEDYKTIPENYAALQTLIGSFVEQLSEERIKNQKKILELWHVGKFMMLLDEGLQIARLSERPDIILRDSEDKLIGVEHQIIIDVHAKEREGVIENVFSRAEQEIQEDNDLPNFLANCLIKPDFHFKLSDKASIKDEIKRIVKHFVLTNTLLPNSIIYHMISMPHSQKNISPNLGAWGQKAITAELILSAIASKDKKVIEYRAESASTQWLLLVIGSLNESSYEVEGDLEIDIATGFEKVFLLEDFRNRLYELK